MFGKTCELKTIETSVKQEYPDCNNCIHISVTEDEQVIKGVEHECRLYHNRLFHRTNSIKHNSYIYPCHQCLKDGLAGFYSKKGLWQ